MTMRLRNFCTVLIPGKQKLDEIVPLANIYPLRREDGRHRLGLLEGRPLRIELVKLAQSLILAYKQEFFLGKFDSGLFD